MTYYGLAMNPGLMGGDNRLGFIIGGILEIPSLLIVLLTINIVGRKFLSLAGFLLAGMCLFASMIILATTKKGDYEIFLMLLVVIGKSALTGVYAVMYIFTPELFPTTVRSTAMGLCSMIARVGAVSASYVAMYLAERSPVAACSIFAVLATAAGFACLGLPETAGQPLLETIEDAEAFGKKLPMFKFMEKKKPKPGKAAATPEAAAQEEILLKPASIVEDPRIQEIAPDSTPLAGESKRN